MNLKLVQTAGSEPILAEPSLSAYPEYPIEQSFGSDDPAAQQQLMQQASRGSPEPEQRYLSPTTTGCVYSLVRKLR